MTTSNQTLAGRVALVTGAGVGIGHATAILLAQAGATVGVHYHSSKAGADETVQAIRDAGGQAHILSGDLTREADANAVVDQLIEKTGKLDILFNNAGSPVKYTTIEACSLELWQSVFAVNATTAFLVSRRAIPHLRASKTGRIINNLTLSIQTGGAGGGGVYAAAKGALQVMTRTLAKELAPHVRVNAIMPGVIATAHHEAFSTPAKMEDYRKQTPLARNGIAEEVAQAVLFLASDASSFMTGAILDINGGRFMREDGFMFELTADNALDYLRRQGWIGTGPAQAEVLSGGVSNFVLRVSTPDRHFVVKQSRPQLRTRDAWFSDLDRIWREQEVMQALHPYLPDVVPEVLHVDRPNYVYAMSHAPMEAKVWKAELLAGNIDVALGKKVGQVLGRIHQISAEQASRFDVFRDHNVYVQLRVDPFYVRVQERRPEVAAAIAPIIHDMLTIKEALCHGDYTPKNILVHDAGFTLVDYETAHFGDPTMDLGLFLAHLTLKATRDRERASEFVSLMWAFWRAYCDNVSFCQHAELERRGMRHLGVCLLARIDGTSPVDYLPDEHRREWIRDRAREILSGHFTSWEHVWHLL